MTKEPKQHIEEISQDYRDTSKRILDALSGSIDRLGKAFSRRGHFVMEFIQNADDAGAKQLMLEISDGKIKICNDGGPFVSKEVESICSVGHSSKPIEDYIGYLGVGFKSVFLISDSPQIYSGDYQFKFDKNHWPNAEELPWQIMPIWLSESAKEEWNTVFTIPLKNPEISDMIRKEVAPECLDRRILLFLRNLREIIIDNGNGKIRNIIKRDIGKGLYVLEERNEGILLEERWLIFRKLCEVPSDVKADYVTKEWEREKVKKREVIIAFRLNEENDLEEVEGTAHIGVFSFLPLKEEIEIGLKFNFQADFLTAPGREVITRETKWNQWLSQEVYNTIIEICIPSFLEHVKWKMNFTKVLYPGIGGHSLFDEYIKKPLSDYLNNNHVLIAEDGSTVKATEVISIGVEVRDLLSVSDLPLLYPDKKILHRDCQAGLNIAEGPETVTDFVKSTSGQRLLSQKAENEDIKWFRGLYSKISDESMEDLSSEDIILTSKGEVAEPREVYIKLETISVPPEIEGNFKLVHPNLLDDPKNHEFLTKLGIKELTNEHIQSIIKIKELPEISKNWAILSDEQRLDFVKLFKKLWAENKIEVNDLVFLTLKTKSGKWISAKEIIFSAEYNPSHSLERLLERGLLDICMEFLSTDFIQDGKDVWNWRRFFVELGVDEKLVKEGQSIVQRIGVKKALQVEEKRGWQARELGESEKPGYDIESKLNSDVRHIEVKSTQQARSDIFLSPNEVRALHDEKDIYFIYFVGNALQEPRLYAIRGSKLLATSPKMIIPKTQWRNLSEEEF